MSLPENIESLIANLPDAESARRFYLELANKHPSEEKRLVKNSGLLSDVLTLAAFSPLLATTLLQHPNYISWLNRQRVSAKVRGKDELLESLARFALVNSQVEPNILLARFRRRELLRIYLRDIRNLGTIVEITEEISNLADAILEYALRLSQQELDNRYGIPLEIDEKKRAKQARFCIVALGKLGSNELNYASDIDLLFLYSNDGATSGQGSHKTVTNREYFVKLAEFVRKIVGGQSGEGAAYRVDLRLRPHGRVGALAVSVREAVNYYQESAQSWERQVLIRSRACAGDANIFHTFFNQVKANVFSIAETVENALQNVLLSKEKINLEKTSDQGFNVKLGKGGIREIEFIAQALQLAYGGNDQWLRAPHTLISLARLADRHLLTETELTELFEAYSFLRRIEHRLQMENGLQTHLVANNEEKRSLLMKQMDFDDLTEFDKALKFHSANVNQIFSRVFNPHLTPKRKDAKNSYPKDKGQRTKDKPVNILSETSPHFAEMFAANLDLIEDLFFTKVTPSSRRLSSERLAHQTNISESAGRTLDSQRDAGVTDVSPSSRRLSGERLAHLSEIHESAGRTLDSQRDAGVTEKDYRQIFMSTVQETNDFAHELAVLRKTWSRFLLEIVAFDVFDKISLQKARTLQTNLAEASIETALFITRRELERRFSTKINDFPIAVLGLGKLGGGGMDYGSDLDLILVYDVSPKSNVQRPTSNVQESNQRDIVGQEKSGIWNLESGIWKAVEIFVTTLSSLTRDGHLYRVDLRLRPDGKNGATSISKPAFLNYLENRAAIWEWLAYIKLRGVAGDLDLAISTEHAARKIIHENALKADIKELQDETWRVRKKLEEAKSATRKSKEIDIKFGAGGMLDIYFAMRFLQLRFYIPDDAANRSTLFMLDKLHEKNSLSAEDFHIFKHGYEFLSELDHNLRLVVGRSTRLPMSNQTALQTIVTRMKFASIKDLLEQLTFHRLNIRASFENILR